MSDPGRVYTGRPAGPPASVLTRLAELGVCRLADVHGAGLMSPRLRPVFEPMPTIVGLAVTVKVTPGDFAMIPWAVDQLGPGDVLVVDGCGHSERAIWGDFVGARARAVGCAGVVVDGACRDVAGIERLRLPVFASARNARGPTRTGHGDVNVPVCCGGVTVLPGDIVVGGSDGIVAVPLADIDRIVELAEAKAAAEPRRPEPGHDGGDVWHEYLTQVASRSGRPTIHRSSWRQAWIFR